MKVVVRARHPSTTPGPAAPGISSQEAMAANCNRLDDAATPWFFETKRGPKHPAAPRWLEDELERPKWDADGMCAALRSRAGATVPASQHPDSVEVRCAFVPSYKSLWAIHIEYSPAEHQMGTWSLRYVDELGRASTVESFPWSHDGDPSAPGGGSPFLPELTALFDLDGDGRSEAVTLTKIYVDANAHTRSSVVVWRVKGQAIEPHPAVDFVAIGLVDQDDDGRPDFVLDPYPVGTSFGSLMVGNITGKASWSLLAHTLAGGTFSLSDPVATAYAHELCAAPPAMPSAFAVDQMCWAGLLHCANLWRVRGAARELQSRCHRELAEPAAMPGWCARSLSGWSAILSTALPLRLER